MACRSPCRAEVEGALDPLGDLRFAVEGEHVEAAGAVHMVSPCGTVEPVAGRSEDAPLFCGSDALGGAAVVAAPAVADFEEDERAVVQADEVDLPAAAGGVAPAAGGMPAALRPELQRSMTRKYTLPHPARPERLRSFAKRSAQDAHMTPMRRFWLTRT